MIHIYHSKDFRASCDGINEKWFSEADCKAAFLADKYELVASINDNEVGDMASRNTAYAMTQHINDNWTDNDDKDLRVFSKDTPKRSTSVGDLFMNGKGEFWIVQPVGFKKLESFANM